MLNAKLIGTILALQIGGGVAAIGVWNHYHQPHVCVAVDLPAIAAQRATDQKVRQQLRIEDPNKALQQFNDR